MNSKSRFFSTIKSTLFLLLLGLTLSTCETEELVVFTNDAAVFLLLDEDCIDNGNEPNNFSERDVNDQIAEVGQRLPLRYFQNNLGKIIELHSGEVGDEGWFALKTIPGSWTNAGPATNGLLNYLAPGPGLGGGEDDREVLLDKIPNVVPLRATGLSMLQGTTVLALVYDGDISINYSPLNGNLMGNTLGLVAFDVLELKERLDASSSSLPSITLRIREVTEVSALSLALFSNVPIPKSSSEPFDIVPPTTPPLITLVPAN